MSLGFGSDSAGHDFIDVQEAQKAGYLSTPVIGPGAGGKGGSSKEKPVCQRSLTFVLESTDVGLGKALIMLWTAYGLAEKEGRAFFIDDTRWAYGKYSAIFQPPPVPECSAPLSHEILPCPRQARHLVASAATMDETFGSFITPADLLSKSRDRTLRKTQFSLARRGYESLFHLTPDDATYVDKRVRELTAAKLIPKTHGQRSGLAVGVHVRLGDLHPFEFQYRRSYIPLNLYADTARNLIDAHFNRSGGREDAAGKAHSLLVLASDDPMVYESDELRGSDCYRAQERIKLASKQHISQKGGAVQPDRSVMHRFVDDAFGWEGVLCGDVLEFGRL
ncbi:hypothetical protein N0V88_003984 [Collariella sp. IMI 366227]|nr:hypothetical protein N0V88_003984 [Collariella sp. IMI 366227]